MCSSDGATAHRLGEDGGFVGRPLLLTGGGFAASGIRGKKKQMHKVPVSGGVEGLDDDFLNSIKRRVNPNDFDPTEGECRDIHAPRTRPGRHGTRNPSQQKIGVPSSCLHTQPSSPSRIAASVTRPYDLTLSSPLLHLPSHHRRSAPR